MERIGHLEVDVQPCLMQEDPWYYRNKVQMPLGYDKNGQLVTGFYKQRTNDIIACDECLIQNEESNTVIQRVKELFVQYDIKPYDKTTHQGNIKHVLTKKAIIVKNSCYVSLLIKKQSNILIKLLKRLSRISTY